MNRTNTVGITESVFNSKYEAVCQSLDKYYIHSLSPNDKECSVPQVFPSSNTAFRN